MPLQSIDTIMCRILLRTELRIKKRSALRGSNGTFLADSSITILNLNLIIYVTASSAIHLYFLNSNPNKKKKNILFQHSSTYKTANNMRQQLLV